MRKIGKYRVLPALSEELEPLKKIAANLWWVWNKDALELFRRTDEDLWVSTYHNPLKMINLLTQQRVRELENDASFLSHLNEVLEQMETYLVAPTWYSQKYGRTDKPRIGYFSMEFGLHESLQVYSGGLGILSGDHLKSASDLGLPLVAIGLFYHNGYFQQYLNADGWQQEFYPEIEYTGHPVQLQTDDEGNPLRISVEMAGTTVYAHILRVPVGRVNLYLLDANIPDNLPSNRDITAQLYGGDSEMRIRQEIMLGIGGIRALDTLGFSPSAFHMNEGHAAFLVMERIRLLMEGKGLSFQEARETVTASSLFTTHTPVAAGFDKFDRNLMEKYFHNYYPKLDLNQKSFMALGRENPHDDTEPFKMAILGLRLAGKANAVAKLHGEVSRKMFRGLFPDLPVADVPIEHVTNGIHVPSWLSIDMEALYKRYFGPGWMERPSDHAIWKRVDSIPDAELWRTHERRRERLVSWARRRLSKQMKTRGAPASEIKSASEVLDPEALTIGFARRFATYKRATLLMTDIQRLKQIVGNRQRPVQFIFAGKAHPKDTPGKKLIQELTKVARDPNLRRHIVFIENYDINVARYLTSGVDVWLNNPRRPREASGTSGMKAPINGGINLSILDGWWVEGFNGENGWAIGAGEEYDDEGYQDYVESRLLYDLLEKEIVPLFYDRGADDLPRGWIKKMKNSMKTCGRYFNTHRMVQQYAERYYVPLSDLYEELCGDGMNPVRDFTAWKMKIYSRWAQIRIELVKAATEKSGKVGENLPMEAKIRLAGFSPQDVRVEIYFGKLNNKGEIIDASTVEMEASGTEGELTVFRGALPCTVAGEHGYAVRVLPRHRHMVQKYIPGLIHWQE